MDFAGQTGEADWAHRYRPGCVRVLAGPIHPEEVFGVPEGWLESGVQSEAMLFGTAAHEVLQGRDPKSVVKKYGLTSSSVADLDRIKERF